MKLGLTLSGGGARGAYEAGVVRALAEENVKLHAVSGASIGALNGALVAASPTLSEAADRLEHLWKELGEIELLKEMIDIKLIAAAGARLIIPSPIRFVAGYLYQLLVGKNELFAEFDNNGLLTNKPLRDILNTWISDDALEAGIPLHVSVYEKYSTPQALLAAISSVSGYGDTPHSRYRCLQDMPRHLRRKALLASAALPFVFASQQINGRQWIDGGLGDNLGETGNTPTTPLIEAGCNVIIVTLLQNGSFWNRSAGHDAHAAAGGHGRNRPGACGHGGRDAELHGVVCCCRLKIRTAHGKAVQPGADKARYREGGVDILGQHAVNDPGQWKGVNLRDRNRQGADDAHGVAYGLGYGQCRHQKNLELAALGQSSPSLFGGLCARL